MKDLKRFICEEDAMGTVEVVFIVAVLIGLGILFKNKVLTFVENHLKQLDGAEVNIENLGSSNGGATDTGAGTSTGTGNGS